MRMNSEDLHLLIFFSFLILSSLGLWLVRQRVVERRTRRSDGNGNLCVNANNHIDAELTSVFLSHA
jgi:hypothetical protein